MCKIAVLLRKFQLTIPTPEQEGGFSAPSCSFTCVK